MDSAIDVMERVEKDAQLKAKADPVSYGSMAIGDYHRQGDVYIQRIKEVPSDTKPITAVSQLAPGNTQGSRHILDSTKGVEMFALKNPTSLDGPIIKTKKKVTVTHPEHGHVTLPAGTYAITYQRQYAEELRRVED